SDTTVAPSTQYVYRLSALSGQVMSAPSNLIVATTAAISPTGRPVITQQPAALVAPPGASVSLTTATTTARPVYQWQLNGLNLAGAKAATLQIASLQPAQSGLYTATIYDAGTPAILSSTAPVPVSVAAASKLTG